MRPQPPPLMRKAKVILLVVLAAVTYGIIHDQITAHLCVEYFTVGHPNLFHTDSPILLGFCWGVAATVGIGAVFGAVLAEVSQSPGLPPYPMRPLRRSLLILIATMAVAAFLSGLLGFELSRHSIIRLPVTFNDLILPSRRDRFMAAWFAHGASYLVGFAGGAFLIFRIWTQRGRPPVIGLVPRTRLAIIRALLLACTVAVILYLRFRP
jgi:hypothetical protein